MYKGLWNPQGSLGHSMRIAGGVVAANSWEHWTSQSNSLCLNFYAYKIWDMGWRGRREGGSGWGTHVNPWLILVNVWQKPLQYCKVISLQLIKINGKKMWDSNNFCHQSLMTIKWLKMAKVPETLEQLNKF